MPEPSDEELIRSFQRGETAAFETLYRRHRDWVVTIALRYCGHREDALDVLQETFAYFFRKLPGFELRCRFRTFLFPAVKHLALSRREASKRRGSAPEAEPAIEPRDTGSLEPLLTMLPEEQREVVHLRFADGFELKEIAEALSIPLGTVKSRLHEALKKLRGTSTPEHKRQTTGHGPQGEEKKG